MRVFEISANIVPEAAMFSSQMLFQRDTELPSTEIDGEIVLMSSRTGRYYSLTGSAASVWRALGTAATVNAVCESLMKEYEVDEQTCRQEVNRFIEALSQSNLVRTAEA